MTQHEQEIFVWGVLLGMFIVSLALLFILVAA